MRKTYVGIVAIALLVLFQVPVQAETWRVRLFFGLSLPAGGGVSLAQWQAFEKEHIVTTFEGYNVVDSVGVYKGKPERSKILTLIVEDKELAKVKAVARQYAKTFHQDSVMMVKVAVADWQFIGVE